LIILCGIFNVKRTLFFRLTPKALSLYPAPVQNDTMRLSPKMQTRMIFASLSERARSLLPMATISVGAALAFRRLNDYDTWWHLASGRWIVDNRTIPTTDTLSYTVPDHPWINLQWLFDVMLYLSHSVGGANLLVILCAAAFTTAVWMLMKNLREWLDEVSASILCLWAILIAEERFLVRPEMVSFILLQVVLWVLMTARRNEGRTLWVLVPVMLLWVNCHSLFVIGLFCIGCTVAGTVAARLPLLPSGWREASSLGPEATRRLFLSAGAAALVTLLNPYFLEGLLFPLKLMSRFDVSNAAFQTIGEFRPPFSGYFPTFSIGAFQAFFFLGIAVTCGAAVAGWRAPRNAGRGTETPAPGFHLVWLLIFMGLAYLSVLARRNTSLFALGATPIVGAYLALIGSRAMGGMRDLYLKAAKVAAPVLFAMCIGLIGAIATNTYYWRDGTTREFGFGILEVNFPIRAAAFSREAGFKPRLYNDLTAGGYLTWDQAVEGGVFIDGRLEVYDAEFFTYYLSAFTNARIWRQQLEKYEVNTVLLFHRWGNRHPMIRLLMADPAWTLVYHDEVAVIFVRNQGNEEAIEKAREIYPAWQERISAALRAPTTPWQWPVGRVRALSSYASLLSLIGEAEASIELQERLLGFHLPAEQESRVRIIIGSHLGNRGELKRALGYLERAAELDPSNRPLQEMIQRVKHAHPELQDHP